MATVLNRSIGVLAYVNFDYTKSEYILIPNKLMFIPPPHIFSLSDIYFEQLLDAYMCVT